MEKDTGYGLVIRLKALRDLLGRGEYTKAEICQRLPRHYQSDPASSRRLGRDISALRQFGYAVSVDRSAQTYSLKAESRLALSDEDVQTLALMRETFEGFDPKSVEVQAVLGQIAAALPESQRRLYHRQPPLSVRLKPAVDYRPYAQTMRLLERAILENRKVRFAYPALDGEEMITHIGVEPHEIQFFDRHFYLIGLGPTSDPALEFRIDRFKDLELMPGRVARRRPRQTVPFRYRLSPRIARLGVSERFLNSQITPQPDGSVVIQAEGYSEFRIIQELLRYGEQAELLTPLSLRTRIAHVVKAMARLYPDDQDK